MLPVAGVPATENAGNRMNSIQHRSPSRRSAATFGSIRTGVSCPALPPRGCRVLHFAAAPYTNNQECIAPDQIRSEPQVEPKAPLPDRFGMLNSLFWLEGNFGTRSSISAGSFNNQKRAA